MAAVILIVAVGAGGCARKAPPEDVPAAGPIVGPAGRLHVDDGGEGGIPVLFVHSYAGSSDHWSAQLAHLRSTRRAIAMDLRGHGKSEAPASGVYEVDSLAADIAAVADGLGLDRFVLVGHSLGGSAATAYARLNPNRVAGLVLVGAPGQTPPEQSKQIMATIEANYDSVMTGYWKSITKGAQPAVETRLQGEMKSVSQGASLAILRAVFAYDPLPALNAYPGPKLIVDTEHGESPGALHNLVPSVPRQVITGTSHWPHLDKPEEFNQTLDEFLTTVN